MQIAFEAWEIKWGEKKSHNADQTKKKSFEYSGCLHLALTEHHFYLHFPCRNPTVKTQNGEAPRFHYVSSN